MQSLQDRRISLLVGFLLLCVFAIIALMKLRALYTWGYGWDLFTYDQMALNTIHGRLGLEYRWGNQYGDHAYWFLLLLTPVKLALGIRFLDFLLMLGPLIATSAVLLTYRASQRFAGSAAAAAVAVSLISTYGSFPALLEVPHGFHFDTFAGFLFVALTAALIASRVSSASFPTAAICVVGLALLKEESVLLCVVFFSVLWLATRCRRFGLLSLGLSSFFVIDLAAIRLFQSEWNRSNSRLFHDLAARAVQPELPGPEVLPLIGVVAVYLLLYCCAVALSGSASVETLALVVTAIVKLGAAPLARDYDPISWHNFPGIVMLSGAVVLQLATSRASARGRPSVILLLFAILAAAGFLVQAAPVLSEQLAAAKERALFRRQQLASVRSLQAIIPAEAIVAVPSYMALDWAGFQRSDYPHGTWRSPRGIADYVVLDRFADRRGGLKRREFASAARSGELDGGVLLLLNHGWYDNDSFADEFAPAAAAGAYTLYMRKAITKEHLGERRRFTSRFGVRGRLAVNGSGGDD